MRRSLYIDVPGVAAPQGSKKGFSRAGSTRVQMVESSARVKPWRESIRAAALAEMGDDWTPIDGPVEVTITYYLPRPKSHYGTGRNAGQLKPTVPLAHTTKPDIDKLDRAVLDALTSAGVWRDDSQVWSLYPVKLYADDAPVTVIRICWGADA